MLSKLKNILLILFLLPFILWSEPAQECSFCIYDPRHFLCGYGQQEGPLTGFYVPEHLTYGIPSESDLLLNKKGFSLGYSQKYKQAIWVSYILEAHNLQSKQVPRRNKFKPDPSVKNNPVKPSDYSKTGYDRGHLAPAADMTYSVITEQESFYMTNMSPQIPGCNRGIWKRVESQVRDWAIKEEKICVITGPIFAKDYKKMGKADIAVPVAFYKVILDLTPPRKMIAFIIPNEPSKRRIQSFIVPVDKVESITGFHFFSELLDHPDYELKKKSNYADWK